MMPPVQRPVGIVANVCEPVDIDVCVQTVEHADIDCEADEDSDSSIHVEHGVVNCCRSDRV